MSNCTFLKRNQYKFGDFPIYFTITYPICPQPKKEKAIEFLPPIDWVFKRVQNIFSSKSDKTKREPLIFKDSRLVQVFINHAEDGS